MLAAYNIGLSPSAFNCSITGVCAGLTADAQRVFTELQQQINRLSGVYGIVSRLAVDGKIGTRTVTALRTVVERIAQRVGSAIDPSVEAVIIDIGDVPIGPREVAENADAILAALKRDGLRAGAVVSPYSGTKRWPTIATVFQQITAGAALPPKTPPGVQVAPPPPAPGTEPPPAYLPPAAPIAPMLRIPTWLMVTGAATGVVLVGAVLVAVFRRA